VRHIGSAAATPDMVQGAEVEYSSPRGFQRACQRNDSPFGGLAGPVADPSHPQQRRVPSSKRYSAAAPPPRWDHDQRPQGTVEGRSFCILRITVIVLLQSWRSRIQPGIPTPGDGRARSKYSSMWTNFSFSAGRRDRWQFDSRADRRPVFRGRPFVVTMLVTYSRHIR